MIAIRTAVASDAPQIAHAHIDSAQNAYAPLAKAWTRPDHDQRARQWAQWLNAPTSIALVATVNRQVVGFIRAGGARLPAGAGLEVSVVHVLPKHRGSGVGGMLWSQACGQLRGAALRSMYVEAFTELPACAFFEARGGLLASTTPDTYHGGPVHRAVYVWPEGRSHDQSPYRLRATDDNDGEFLFALKRSAYRDHVVATWGSWDEADQRQRFFGKFDPRPLRIIVCQGRDVGALGVDWDDATVTIRSIELLSDVRGQGLGTRVMSDVLARAVVLGADLQLQVFKSNVDARRLYERLGFTSTGATETHVSMRHVGGS